nr:MAG TPA: hypothetical protein [Caudoviricetes sp.]DAY04316.1 MAG TPA: hypothetical protein [Caudoviricetes sp.]
MHFAQFHFSCHFPCMVFSKLETFKKQKSRKSQYNQGFHGSF